MTVSQIASDLTTAARVRREANRQVRDTVASAYRKGLPQRQIATLLDVSQAEVYRLLHSSAARNAEGRRRTWMTARDASKAASQEIAQDDDLMAFKMMVQARDHLLSLTGDDIAEWSVEPPPIADVRFDTLLRALARRTFAALGRQAPSWASSAPPDEPWVPHPFSSGRARAMHEAPQDLAALGIFITEEDLVTA